MCVLGGAGRYGGWFVPASSYYRHGHVFIFCASVRSSERRKKLFLLFYLYITSFFMGWPLSILSFFSLTVSPCAFILSGSSFLRVPLLLPSGVCIAWPSLSVLVLVKSVFGTVYIICALG